MSKRRRRVFICESCGLENLTELDYCVACKAPMPVAEPVVGGSAPAPAAQPAAILSCTACGAPIQPAWRFCDKCGAQRVVAQSAAPAQQPAQAAPLPRVAQQPMAPPQPAPPQPVYAQPQAAAPMPPVVAGLAPPAVAPQPVYADGNTSGLGSAYPLPNETGGCSFAGAVPLGLFAFYNRMTGLGILGVFTTVFALLSPIYFFIIMFGGKAMAWRNRRFNSVSEYTATMRVWNGWGVTFVILHIVFWIVFVLMAIARAIADSAVEGVLGG